LDDGKERFQGELHELTEKIIGVFFLVSNELGTGFVELIYQRALCIALQEAGLRVEQERPIDVWFHGQKIGVFKADIVVNGIVMLELKVGEHVDRQFEAQLLHYLRATEIEVGMVLVFGTRARFRRLSLLNETKTGNGLNGD
jgi:GxxExxY protein